MRRVSLPVGALSLILLLAATIGGPALAQDASPGATEGHPVVGSWLVDTNADDPANPPSSVVFHADGTYIEVDVGGVAVGVWEPTGPQTAAGSFVFRGADDTGAVSSGTVRAVLEVAPDGQSFTGTYTLDFTGPEGTATGELGPGRATGTRMTVEPMGSPVGPLPTSGTGANPGASPAATPSTSPGAS